MKKSKTDFQSVKQINFFVDWAIKKKHVALIESESKVIIQSESSFNSGSAEVVSEPKSGNVVQSTGLFNFGSVVELLDSFKTSVMTVPSIAELNVFLESGAPYLLLHQFIENGFNVFVVDGKEVKEFRGDREKSDKNDVKYIRDLYHQNPELFHELSEPEKQDVKVKFLMSKYNHFTKDLARFKNRQKSYARQFGENDAYDVIMKELKTKKRRALKQVVPYIEGELEQIDIKGIGKTLMAQLLSVAHPKNFPTLSRFLAYCGYTANTYYKDPAKGYQKNNFRRRYSQLAHTTAWQMATGCVRAQKRENGEQYQLYRKLKDDMQMVYACINCHEEAER